MVDEDNGCRIVGADQVRSPFSGTVKKAGDGIVDIDCDNGLSVHIADMQTIGVSVGDTVSAGGTLGESPSFFLSFWYGDRWIHPYPYILLWTGQA